MAEFHPQVHQPARERGTCSELEQSTLAGYSGEIGRHLANARGRAEQEWLMVGRQCLRVSIRREQVEKDHDIHFREDEVPPSESQALSVMAVDFLANTCRGNLFVPWCRGGFPAFCSERIEANFNGIRDKPGILNIDLVSTDFFHESCSPFFIASPYRVIALTCVRFPSFNPN